MGGGFWETDTGYLFDEIYMMGNPLPWTERLPGRFRETYGYDILDELPSLVDGVSERDKQVRKDYFSLVTAMYEEAFFRQISDWCGKYGLKLTGHTEEFLWEHPRRQGDYFKTMRHLMVPGSDCHDYRYRYPRRITYCEPKYSVSVARIYGKERAMSEALGGAGWNCTMEEFKRESILWPPWEPACSSSMDSTTSVTTRVPRVTGPPVFLSESLLGLF